ncbi:hypothetical protein MNBD_GAMMA17-958 [hydrothermal vent metagenome]|uniref:Bacterial transcriptional activator domain-containing protein n=1 Tax=hydrothermal vent metagenome TaxID=652676 RepID=A0A3B0YXD2_9ZZZZ
MARRVIYPSKIIYPRTAKIIHRSRLFNVINEARHQAKIIWIAAPGGSGKTTLVSSYLEQNQVAHCWYQIDEDDRDLATFFHYLGLAGKLAAPRRKKAVPKLTPEYQQRVPTFTRHFFSDLSSRLQNNGLIVLDNFQLLAETDPLPALLPCIAESLEAGVSLIVMSRHLPPFSMNSLIVKRQLCVINTKLMRFSEEEWVAASHLFRTTRSKEALLSLHVKLDGWIAGLVLLPNFSDVPNNACTSGLGIDALDSYIADQFLSSLDEETSQLLMRVCYMPHITTVSATTVSRMVQSKKLLSKLAQKNLFVLRQGDKGYTVHPLIKEALQQRVESTLSKEQLYELRLATTVALQNDGEYEASADLLLELKEWQALMVVILKHAAELFDSGRIEPLQRYINALPEDFTRREPWIIFWNGKLSTYQNMITALDYYEAAYALFMEKSDAKGGYLTWYAAVSVISGTLQGGDRLDTWVKRYDNLSSRYPELPQELQKGAIDDILLHCYFFSEQSPKKRERLRRGLASAIEAMPDSPMRLKMMSSYVIVAAGSGVREQDMVIFERLENSLTELKDDPVLYLGTAIYSSIGLWSLNAFDKQLALQLQALEVAKESGVSVFYGHIYTHIVIAALGVNKIDLAREYISKLKENITEKDHVYQSLYMTCIIIAETYMDDFGDVDSIAEQYLRNLDNTHIPPFIIHHKLLYIYYLCVRQKVAVALALHDDLLGYCEKIAFHGQTSRFYLIYAKIFFDNGEHERSNRYLKKGFLVARCDEIIACCHWPPALMSWACQRALVLEIETSYVSKFVEKNYHNLLVPNANYQTWPWPFRIFTFGHFEVTSKKEITILKQRAGKSFALLKTLVAALDRGLTSYALKEKLYIDVKREKVSQLLDTQIHRLRKHFDNEQTILRQGDSVKLNLKYFWVDVLEFESLGKRKITTENALEIAIRLQQLYKGEYLPDDDALDVIAQRERYRNIYLATLFKCMDHMQEKKNSALDICQNALVLEPLSEPLYRKLMSIYLSQGNRDMAEVTLGQCNMMISRHLDSSISNKTLSLLNND